MKLAQAIYVAAAAPTRRATRPLPFLRSHDASAGSNTRPTVATPWLDDEALRNREQGLESRGCKARTETCGTNPGAKPLGAILFHASSARYLFTRQPPGGKRPQSSNAPSHQDSEMSSAHCGRSVTPPGPTIMLKRTRSTFGSNLKTCTSNGYHAHVPRSRNA